MNPYNRIKWFIKDTYWDLRKRCQRFKRGYAWSDVWDMDQWFIEMVRPMLIHLRDKGISYPMEFNSRDEWCAVLDEMIDCLDFMDEDNVLAFICLDDQERMTLEKGKSAREIIQSNKNRFFKLFSMYFYNLWD